MEEVLRKGVDLSPRLQPTSGPPVATTGPQPSPLISVYISASGPTASLPSFGSPPCTIGALVCPSASCPMGLFVCEPFTTHRFRSGHLGPAGGRGVNPHPH